MGAVKAATDKTGLQNRTVTDTSEGGSGLSETQDHALSHLSAPSRLSLNNSHLLVLQLSGTPFDILRDA